MAAVFGFPVKLQQISLHLDLKFAINIPLHLVDLVLSLRNHMNLNFPMLLQSLIEVFMTWHCFSWKKFDWTNQDPFRWYLWAIANYYTRRKEISLVPYIHTYTYI